MMKRQVVLTLVLAGAMTGLPTLMAQRTDDSYEGSEAAAIRYEKAKEAAAERQERIEARQRGGRESADRADRVVPEHRAPRNVRASAAARRTPPQQDRQ